MITLKTFEIETQKDVDSLITNLQLHTRRLEITSLNFFWYFFLNSVTNQWVGETDRARRKFRLLRNIGQPEIGVRLSRVVIKGQIIEESNRNLIKVRLQPTAFVFLNDLALGLLAIAGVVLIPVDTLVEYWWAFAIYTILLIFNLISLAKDCTKTEAKIIEFFNDQGDS
jgi:hypothetical protein